MRKKIKLAFRTSGFKKKDIFTALKIIRGAGYDGVELCLEHPDLHPAILNSKGINKIKGYMEAIEIETAAVSYHGKLDSLEEKFRLSAEGMRICKDFGFPFIIISSVKRGKKKRDTEFMEFLKFMKRLCKLASRRNILIALEPEPDTVIHGTEEMERLFEGVQSDYLKVNLDIGHCFITEGEIYKTVKSLNDRIIHIHIDDIKDVVHEHLIPGEGDIDFRRVFSALEDINYKGFWTIDLFDILEKCEEITKKSFSRFSRMVSEYPFSE